MNSIEKHLQAVIDLTPQVQMNLGGVYELYVSGQFVVSPNTDEKFNRRWQTLAFYLDRINAIALECQKDFEEAENGQDEMIFSGEANHRHALHE